MANESKLVTVDVVLEALGISRQGYGIPMLVSNTGNAWSTSERTRTYDISDGLSGVIDDFPITTVEYQAIAQMAAQANKPTTIIVGKGTNIPTEIKAVAVLSAASGETYTLNVYNDGVAWTAEYTAGGGDTTVTIATALVAQLTPAAWAASTGYVVGDRVTHDSGKVYDCTTAGTSGGAATAGSETQSAGPFTMNFPAAGTWIPIFDLVPQTYTFASTRGYKDGVGGVFAGVAGNLNLRLNGDSDTDQTIVFDGSENTVAKAIARVNELGIGCGCVDTGGGQMHITSDRFGKGSSVNVLATSTAGLLTTLGLASGVGTAGTCTADVGAGPIDTLIQFTDAITATEMATMFAQAGLALVGGTYTDNGDGTGTLTSATTGAASSVQCDPAAESLLGFDGALHSGTAAGVGAGPTGTGTSITDGTAVWDYVATPNFTAANGGGASATITCTGSSAGNWFAIEPVCSTSPTKVPDRMSLQDNTADAGISADLTAILAADSTWYAICLLFKSKAIVTTPSTGAAAWAQANERLLFVGTSDSANATAALSGATDIGATMVAATQRYVAGDYHPRDYEFIDAATLGLFLPLDPGSDNWCNKALAGVTAFSFTTTQITNIEARRLGYYWTVGSLPMIGGDGKVMDSVYYGFIDTVRNLDWYKTNLQADLIDLLVKNNKLPNTSAGRRIIAAAIAARNDAGIAAGVISPDPLDPTNVTNPIMLPYTVYVPPVSDATSFTASTRTLTGVKTKWKYASPIDHIDVTVNVSQ